MAILDLHRAACHGRTNERPSGRAAEVLDQLQGRDRWRVAWVPEVLTAGAEGCLEGLMEQGSGRGCEPLFLALVGVA